MPHRRFSLSLRALCLLSLALCPPVHAAAPATGGDDIFFFQGSLQPVDITLANPYSGETVSLSRVMQVATESYDGLAGTDTLILTNADDLLNPTTGGSTYLRNIEVFLSGDGSDVLNLAGGPSPLGNAILFSGEGDDVIWSGSGNDVLVAAGGNDTLNGGPGDDEMHGQNGDDRFVQFLGAGHDTIFGGPGANEIYFADLLYTDLAVTSTALGYFIAVGSLGDTLEISDIQTLRFSNGIYSTPESLIGAVPLPPGVLLLLSALAGLMRFMRNARGGSTRTALGFRMKRLA